MSAYDDPAALPFVLNEVYPNGDLYPYHPENWARSLPMDRIGFKAAAREIAETAPDSVVKDLRYNSDLRLRRAFAGV